jgi:hypothetical protein
MRSSPEKIETLVTDDLHRSYSILLIYNKSPYCIHSNRGVIKYEYNGNRDAV